MIQNLISRIFKMFFRAYSFFYICPHPPVDIIRFSFISDYLKESFKAWNFNRNRNNM